MGGCFGYNFEDEHRYRSDVIKLLLKDVLVLSIIRSNNFYLILALVPQDEAY